MCNDLNAWNALATGSWKRSAEQRWFHDHVLYPGICGRLPVRCRLLDYGCGSGELIASLTVLGHDVVGFDPASEMAHRAQAANPRIQILTDLRSFSEEQFEAVLLNLVLSCTENAADVCKNAAAFAPRVIVTVPHPCFSLFSDLHTTTQREWIVDDPRSDERELYFLKPKQKVTWDNSGSITTVYHRSISGWLQLFEAAALLLDGLAELLPDAGGRQIPHLYQRFSHIPAFMLFDLRRNGK